MSTVVVRYKVKPDQGDENQRLVENVFKELAATDPGGVRYGTFRLADGVSFIHIASIETEDGSNPLGNVAAFAEFQKDIAERCDEPPSPQGATLVGSYPNVDRSPGYAIRLGIGASNPARSADQLVPCYKGDTEHFGQLGAAPSQPAVIKWRANLKASITA